MTDLELNVRRLPCNRLALTDEIYVSPSTLDALRTSVEGAPEAYPTTVALTVDGRRHPFVAGSHPEIAEREIALNGLQRKFAGLRPGDAVSCAAMAGPYPLDLSFVEFSVSALKKKGEHDGRPCDGSTREVNTDRLAGEVWSNYCGHFFEVGRTVATKFESGKFLLTVAKVEIVANFYGKCCGHNPDDASSMGRLNSPNMAFSNVQDSDPDLVLTGSRVAGSLITSIKRKASRDTLETIVESNPKSMEEADELGRTPLHWAFYCSAPMDVVQFLAEKRPKAIWEKEDDGSTPAHVACGRRGTSLEMVSFLVEKCPWIVEEKDKHGQTLLYEACTVANRSMDVVRFLAELYPEALEAREKHYGWTPLHGVCSGIIRRNTPIALVEFLISKYPEALNAKDKGGRLPLHVACSDVVECSPNPFSLEIARLLAEKNPDALKVKDRGGMTPLHHACYWNAPVELVKFLVEIYPGALQEKDCSERRSTPLEVLQHKLQSRGAASVEENISNLLSNADYQPVVPEVYKLLTMLHRLDSDSVEEVLHMLSVFCAMEWWGGVALLYDAHPSIVHSLGLADCLIPHLLRFLGSHCKLQSFWVAVKDKPDMLKEATKVK